MTTRKNTNIIKGDELWVFIGVDRFKPTAFATAHSLNRNMGVASVSSKDHANQPFSFPTESNWTVSTDALYSIDGFTDAMDMFDLGELVWVSFGTISNYTAQGIVDNENPVWKMETGWVGQGYVTNISANAAHGEVATFTIEITGATFLHSDVITMPPSRIQTLTPTFYPTATPTSIYLGSTPVFNTLPMISTQNIDSTSSLTENGYSNDYLESIQNEIYDNTYGTDE